MKWFGTSWGAYVCADVDHVDAPIGRPCAVCALPIEATSRGLLLPFSGGPTAPPTLPYHLSCFLDSVLWPPERCTIARLATNGAYYCSREPGHEGPCAAWPKGSEQ